MKCRNYDERTANKKHLPKSILIALLLCSATANAQLHPDLGHGQAALEKATEHYRNDRKDDALKVLAEVHRSDSLYERVLYSRVEILAEQEEYAKARTLCNEGIRIGGMRFGSFHVMRTAILLDEKRYDEALASADSTITLLPGLFRPRHLKALALAGAGKKKEALELAMENARYFPYRREPHVLLGTIAFNEGQLAEAALALSLAQIVRFDDAFGHDLLVYYDAILNNKVEPKPDGYDLSITKDELDEPSLLLKNQVAMDRKYKVKPNLEYPMCRQSHLLFASMENVPANGGFYSEFYGRCAREIMSKDLFEGFVYHCLNSSQNDQISRVAKKNSSKVTAFRQKMSEMLQTQYRVFPHEPGGPDLVHLYNNDGDLLSYGPGDLATGKIHGTWTYFHANGRMSARGDYSAEGKKQGTWMNWYENGVEQNRAEFTDGELDGPLLQYNILGNLRDSSTVHGQLQQGLVCSYYPLGGRRACKTAVDDVWNGPAFDLFQSGATEFEYILTDGKAEGTVMQYWGNGTVRYQGEYTADQREGVHRDLHENGEKAKEYTYVAGKNEGPYKEWYYHGQLAQEGNMKGGRAQGEIRKYDEFGTLSDITRYDDQGRLQGVTIEYNSDGTPYMELEYNKDLLVRYRYLDRSGKVVSEGSRSKGKFDLKGFHPEGGKKVEGTYLDEGAKDGVWKYYYADGTLQSQEEFNKGTMIGKETLYDVKGKLTGEDEMYDQNGVTYQSFRRYYPSGKLKDEGQWKNNSLEGMVRRYHPDGSLKSVEYYVNGTRHGWQDEYDVAGKLRYSDLRVDGALAERVNYDDEGNEYERIKVQPGAFELVMHHPQGATSARLQMMNGVLHGTATWTFPNGKNEVDGGFLNGERHGEWNYYHPNGKKSYTCTYRLGDRIGPITSWYSDGTLEKEAEYVEGYVHGTETNYHINGKVASKKEYFHGVLHGQLTSHSLDGTPQLVRFYYKGKLVGYASPVADGAAFDTIPLYPAGGKIESHFANGKPARIMTYVNDELDGEFLEYHPNGQLMERSTFDAGEWLTAEEFHSNGKPHRTSTRVDGKLHGERLVYWDNGQVRQRQNYVNGELHGTRTFYDRNGKATETYRMRNGDVVEIIN